MRVKNRCNSVVLYTIPDLNIKRRFAPGEVKNIAQEELEKLAYQPGGLYILANCLQVSQQDAAALDIRPEREYFLTEQGIKDLILIKPLDEFLDALDFAPKGVIDLIKAYSMTLPISDMNKANALKEKTGFDAIKALEFEKRAKQDAQEETTNVPLGSGKRRVSNEQPIATEPTTPKRRVSESQYKIVTE